jgi:3-phenylpropionate/trans-cinnamate dioxygenase ferredoxin reductase component
MSHPPPGSIAIVGASLAGLRAAEELRRRGFRGRLCMVGEEDHFPPYDRPPMSKEVLSHQWELEQARLRLFEPVDATMRLGRRAVGLDRSARQIHLDDGSSVDYEGLVIATGTSVRRLRCAGSELADIQYFRSAADCAQLRERLRGRPRVAVIGAGFIGSEIAAVCRGHGLEVTVVDLAPTPMSEQTGEAMAEYLMEQHRRNGVTLRLGVGVAAIEGTTSAECVRLADGSTVDADVVIVGVGVTPQTEWLAGSGLVIDNGVVCDQHCVPVGSDDTVAAGDVARWLNPTYGALMRVEHWTNAVEQAEYAAGVLLNGATGPGYRSVPYFWSDQYDMHLQAAGITGTETVLVEGSMADRKFVMISRDHGRDVGVIAVNWPARFQRYRRQLTDQLAVAAGQP